MLTILYATVAIGSVIMLVWLARGPFYVPTKRNYVPHIVNFLSLRPGEKAVDLGSGNGRLLIALAEAGAVAHGYEHNPLLVWCSRWNIKRAGLKGKAFVHTANFWNVDVSAFNAVVIYGIPYIMPKLEEKLRRELRPGARVVAHSFPFPTWQQVETYKRVYLYKQI